MGGPGAGQPAGHAAPPQLIPSVYSVFIRTNIRYCIGVLYVTCGTVLIRTTGMLELLLVCMVGMVVVWLLLPRPRPAPVSLYLAPGSPAKQVMAWLLIRLGRARQPAPAAPATLEAARPLPPDSPLATDAVWVGGGGEGGQFLVMSGARRQGGLLQSMLWLRLPGLGLLGLPAAPATALLQQPGEEGGWQAAGLNIVPVHPMQQWRLTYVGDLAREACSR